MSDHKWKNRLLSTGLPLEYQAATVLAKAGFAVSPDFKYARADHDGEKEFALDLRATRFYPFGRPNTISAELALLVECKHRHRGTQWLFVRDPNRPDFSNFTIGCTLRAVDEFSQRLLSPNCTVEFDRPMEFCFKGVEINELEAKAFDSEIREGLAQLQFALPQFVADLIIFNVGEVPFFFCPILLTTASLLVANDDLTVPDIEACKALNDIARPVPFLVTRIEPGPFFERHQRLAFLELDERGDFSRIDDIRQANAQTAPSKVVADLAGGSRFYFHQLFSQVVVCSMDNFSPLLDQICETVRTAMQSSRKVRVKRKHAEGA